MSPRLGPHRRVRLALAAATAAAGSLLPAGAGPLAGAHGLSAEWPTFGYSDTRTFYNPTEERITKDTVRNLVLKWRWPTAESVTASPTVATVDVAGVPTRLVIAGTFDGVVWALRASTGLPQWRFEVVRGSPVPELLPGSPIYDPANRQTNYGVVVSSAAVADVALPNGSTERRVFVGGNDTMFALDAATGALRWAFRAGIENPQYMIESSPLVVGGKVFFGVDCNNWCDKGGFYAVDALDGRLSWFFDLESGTAFHPTSEIHEFDPSMYGPQGEGGCSSIWASAAFDATLGYLFIGSADCPRVPNPAYSSAVFALGLSGNPIWRWRPREIDRRDMDFGATPNVFVLDGRHVVGAPGKDGAYYLLDAPTGQVIWGTKLALGANFGGFYNGATDGRRIFLTSALGEGSDLANVHEEALRGRVFALDARTGNVLWRQYVGSPTVGQNSLIPGVYFSSGLDHLIHAYDADDGDLLWVAPVAGAASSAPAVVDGELYVGSGTGATYRAAVGCCLPDPFGTPLGGYYLPHPIPIGEYGMGIYAFCLATDPRCATERADVVG